MEKILTQRGKIEGERKQVTVMFCDIEAFSPLVESLGPEEAYHIMDDIYEILIHNVYDFEGTVNEMTGDGIMALFGAPVALEDAPQRALWSAQSIHQEIAEFNSKQEKRIRPIKMRIGVHSGPVVVGALGNNLRVEFKAVGNTVNLASRMEGLARPGTTLVTEETFRLTRDLFRFKGIGKKAVKGWKRPVPVYKLISAEKNVYRPRLGSERSIYTEMVGRSCELDTLERQVAKVINGQGSVVNIIGEAGIGKSRLVAELKKRGIIQKTTFFEGRAVSIGRNLSFHPIIDILKQWAEIAPDDTEAATFYKLEKVIKGICSDDGYEILPLVATLMKLSLSGRYAERVKGIEGEALEKLILKNVRELLIKATEQTPLVLIIDDLHWIDKSSIELMESLFRLAEKYPILFIHLFRPGHMETGERITKNIQDMLPDRYVEILLGPLSEQMSQALVSAMLNIDGRHYAVIEKILQRAGGNPFFIEEIVRSLIDQGAVVRRGGKFLVTEKIETISIPHTINDVLMARIDRLEEQTRDLVKVAAVIGRYFFGRILYDVAGVVDDIESRLSHLKELQLVQEHRRMEEVEYRFKHALAQEAAYESILLEKRKELHFKVARSIEKIFSYRLDEFYGMLAYHYSRAEHLEEAERYLIKAGEMALKSSASNEALYYYKEALNIFSIRCGDQADPEKVAMLEKNIATALYNRGQYVEAAEYFDKALNYYRGEEQNFFLAKGFRFFSGLFHLIFALYFPGLKFKEIPTQKDHEVADLLYKRSKVLGIINPKKFFIESLTIFKEITKYNLEKFELGLEMLMSASSLFSFTGISFGLSKKILDFSKNKFEKDNVKLMILYDFLETIHNYLRGDWKKINEYDEVLINKNLSIGEVYMASQYSYFHGCPSIYIGDLDTTRSIIHRLTDIVKVYNNDFSIVAKYIVKIKLLMECRQLDDATLEVDKVIDFAHKRGFFTVLMQMYSCKSLIHLFMKDVEQAKKALQYANISCAKEIAAPIQLSAFYRSQFEYFLYRFEKSMRSKSVDKYKYRIEAFKAGKLLLKISKKAAQHRTEAYRLFGVYYWLQKKHSKALKSWQKAIVEGERIGADLELSRTYFDVGKYLLQKESHYTQLNGVGAEIYLEKAKVMFARMDLQWDLAELREVTGN